MEGGEQEQTPAVPCMLTRVYRHGAMPCPELLLGPFLFFQKPHLQDSSWPMKFVPLLFVFSSIVIVWIISASEKK